MTGGSAGAFAIAIGNAGGSGDPRAGEGANHLTGDSQLLAQLVRVGRQRGREQRLRIGVERLVAQLHGLGHLDYLSKVRDREHAHPQRRSASSTDAFPRKVDGFLTRLAIL